jgi:AraC-like DNA-binding protein
MLFFIGIVITFFLVFLLISKKNKSEADIILTIWLLFIGLHLSSYYLITTKSYHHFPYFLGFDLPLPLVHGPFLYIYTALLTNHQLQLKTKLMHFLPVLIIYILFSDFLFSTAKYREQIYANNGIGYEWQTNLLLTTIIVSGILYVFLSLQLLRRHRIRIRNQYSFIEKINLNWLRYLIFGIGFIWLFVILGNEYLIFLSVIIYVLFIGFYGIRQVGILTNDTLNIQMIDAVKDSLILQENASTYFREIPENFPLSNQTENIQESLNVKYRKSTLSQSMIDEIHQQLQKSMSDEKLFTNAELTLADLASHLNVQSNNLSQVINSKEEKNFFDYVNSLRVEEFKHKLNNPSNYKYTLFSLALECGFNSKTSFNRNFKKNTGVSPSEYLVINKIKLND